MTEQHPPTHTMVLVRSHETGAEEWLCPTCGRRFVMQWPPKFKRIILNAGDDTVRHAASKGGLSFAQVEVSNATGTGGAGLTDSSASAADAPDTLSVEAWLEAIEELDFADHSPGDTRDEDASQTSD